MIFIENYYYFVAYSVDRFPCHRIHSVPSRYTIYGENRKTVGPVTKRDNFPHEAFRQCQRIINRYIIYAGLENLGKVSEPSTRLRAQESMKQKSDGNIFRNDTHIFAIISIREYILYYISLIYCYSLDISILKQ